MMALLGVVALRERQFHTDLTLRRPFSDSTTTFEFGISIVAVLVVLVVLVLGVIIVVVVVYVF